jgi:hypothetical protein
MKGMKMHTKVKTGKLKGRDLLGNLNRDDR